MKTLLCALLLVASTAADADVNYAIVRDPIVEPTVFRYVRVPRADGSIACAPLDPRDWIFENGHWLYKGPGVDVIDLCQDVRRQTLKGRA